LDEQGIPHNGKHLKVHHTQGNMDQQTNIEVLDAAITLILRRRSIQVYCNIENVTI